MKRIVGIASVLILSIFLSTSRAEAREGSLSLTSSNVSCEGISIWRDSSYRVTGRCDGLVYPYATQYDHYVLWATLANGNITRVDDIDRGYFEGNVFDAYNNLFITAETSSSPRRPSTREIVRGSVTAFDFDKSATVTSTPAPTPAPTTAAGGITVQKDATTPSSSTVSGVLGKLLKSLLVIVAVIVIATIVVSLLFRRRGSVSA